MKELKNLDVPKQIKKNYISNISKTETKDTYSKKLATILKKEACSGDFCSHVFDNYEKGGIEELTSNLIDFKELSSIIHEDFHQYQYEISSNLITRARENCEKLPEIFRKYRITNKNPNSQNFKPLLIHKNEYKTVKVCKNCSLIYTVLLKEFKVNKLNKSQAQPKYLHSETYYKNSSKHHLKQYLHIDPPETKIHSIKNISFVNNSKTPIFSLQKEYFFPKSKESKSKIKQKQISQDNFLLKSFNLFKNTVQTRKGEVTLNSVFLEKSNDDIANTMLKSQVNRASLFGNPQKKSFLFAVN